MFEPTKEEAARIRQVAIAQMALAMMQQARSFLLRIGLVNFAGKLQELESELAEAIKDASPNTGE